ncbi:MAG TPA: hypothetical protein VH374_15305 [Polyangia bacterium]|jgi:hypothetical protein|nr:hypothetical protein [Polyangia bacterium]
MRRSCFAFTPGARAAAGGLLLALLGAARPARAQDQTVSTVDRVQLVIPPSPEAPRSTGVIAGSLTALLPLMVGSVLMSEDSRPSRQRDGVYIILGGFAAAPLVSHAVDRRWKRGTIFGLASLATTTATFINMNDRDPFDPDLANRKRLPFGVLLSSAFFAATVGVIDSFINGPVAKERQP